MTDAPASRAAMAAGSPVAPAPITTTYASRSQLAGMCPMPAPNAPGATLSLPPSPAPVVIAQSLLQHALFIGKALGSGVSIAPFAYHCVTQNFLLTWLMAMGICR